MQGDGHLWGWQKPESRENVSQMWHRSREALMLKVKEKKVEKRDGDCILYMKRNTKKGRTRGKYSWRGEGTSASAETGTLMSEGRLGQGSWCSGALESLSDPLPWCAGPRTSPVRYIYTLHVKMNKSKRLPNLSCYVQTLSALSCHFSLYQAKGFNKRE